MKNTHMNLAITALVAAMAIPSIASAYTWETCGGNRVRWRSNPTFKASDVSFPNGGAYKAALQTVFNEINDTHGFSLSVGLGTDTGNISSFNGVNEIAFVSDLPSDVLGREKTKFGPLCYSSSSSRIKESDIRFNSGNLPAGRSWTLAPFTGYTPSQINTYSFHIVALHEVLHGLGLKHTNNKLATMNSAYPNSGTIGFLHEALPHGDDTAGLRFLYGGGPAGNDLVASRFKNGGGASTQPNRIRRASNNTITNSMQKGVSYKIEYSIENNGSSNKNNVKTGFYASTDGYITTSDYYLGAVYWNMPSGSNVQSSVTVNVPTSIPSGSYYIGYVVDSNSNVNESDEENNRAQHFSGDTNGVINIF